MLNPLELELQTLVRGHVGGGDQTQVLCEAGLLIPVLSLQPLMEVFLLILLLEGREIPTLEF